MVSLLVLSTKVTEGKRLLRTSKDDRENSTSNVRYFVQPTSDLTGVVYRKIVGTT